MDHIACSISGIWILAFRSTQWKNCLGSSSQAETEQVTKTPCTKCQYEQLKWCDQYINGNSSGLAQPSERKVKAEKHIQLK
jgi:hypothetical protein